MWVEVYEHIDSW
ncbi:Protein of unknown function [Streptococcus thermophilus]|nr:Protein of unknown function [Streptococcus thermophilus]